MATILEELTALGKEIESTKKDIAVLQGRKAEVMDRLKKEFNSETIEEANKLINDLEAQLTKIEATIETKFAEMKAKYQW